VESMVRDLVEIGVKMVREEREKEVHGRAGQAAEERLLDLLLPPSPAGSGFGAESHEAQLARELASATREKLREQLRAGKLECWGVSALLANGDVTSAEPRPTLLSCP